LSFVCCVGLLPFQEIFLDTLAICWLGYSSFGNVWRVFALGGEFGIVTKYFRENFEAPIHPPLVAVLGPSGIYTVILTVLR
jgi:hypothetical protein